MHAAIKWLVLAMIMSASGCSRHSVVKSTTQLQPTTRAAGTLRQPPLRTILRALGAKGVADADDAVVFVLSHWALDEGPEPEQKRPFEGASFDFEGAKVFLAVGPSDALKRKAPPPPQKDLVVRSEDKDSRGVTIILADQRWHVGFTMKHGDEKTEDKLSRMLLEWLLQYRAARV